MCLECLYTWGAPVRTLVRKSVMLVQQEVLLARAFLGDYKKEPDYSGLRLYQDVGDQVLLVE